MTVNSVRARKSRHRGNGAEAFDQRQRGGSRLPQPVANFVGTPLSGANPLAVTFTDRSANQPTSWLWEKNSGGGYVNFAGTPTAQSPGETFATGVWSIRMTATSSAGSNTVVKTNYITST